MASPTSPTCCNVNPDTVPASSKSDWCRDQVNTCSILCGGQSGVDSNTCDPETLEFTCSCQNTGNVDVSDFSNTIPAHVCEEWRTQCVADNPNDSNTQAECRAQTCPSREPEDVTSSILLPSAASATASGSGVASTVSSVISSSQSSASIASESSSARPSESTTSQTTPAAGSSSGDSNPVGASDGSDLSKGAIAGVAIGGIIGAIVIAAIILFFCRKKSKGNKIWSKRVVDPLDPTFDEKQLAIPIASEVSNKPELHNESVVRELPAHLANGNYSYANGHYDQQTSELHSWSQYQANELDGSTHYPPMELHSTSRSPESQVPSPPEALGSPPPDEALASTQPEPPSSQSSQSPPFEQQPQSPLSNQTYQPPPVASEPRVNSPVPTTLSMQQLSSAEIAALEEEERRIDAEMEEVQRLKDLREQKFAIQKKLRDAKG